MLLRENLLHSQKKSLRRSLGRGSCISSTSAGARGGFGGFCCVDHFRNVQGQRVQEPGGSFYHRAELIEGDYPVFVRVELTKCSLHHSLHCGAGHHKPVLTKCCGQNTSKVCHCYTRSSTQVKHIEGICRVARKSKQTDLVRAVRVGGMRCIGCKAQLLSGPSHSRNECFHVCFHFHMPCTLFLKDSYELSRCSPWTNSRKLINPFPDCLSNTTRKIRSTNNEDVSENPSPRWNCLP